jgi:hypothetical protein
MSGQGSWIPDGVKVGGAFSVSIVEGLKLRRYEVRGLDAADTLALELIEKGRATNIRISQGGTTVWHHIPKGATR